MGRFPWIQIEISRANKIHKGETIAREIVHSVVGYSPKSLNDIKHYQGVGRFQLSLPTEEMNKDFLSIQEKVDWVVVFDPVYCRKSTSKHGLYDDILKYITHTRPVPDFASLVVAAANPVSK